jgi:hypothetical protein
MAGDRGSRWRRSSTSFADRIVGAVQSEALGLVVSPGHLDTDSPRFRSRLDLESGREVLAG